MKEECASITFQADARLRPAAGLSNAEHAIDLRDRSRLWFFKRDGTAYE